MTDDADELPKGTAAARKRAMELATEELNFVKWCRHHGVVCTTQKAAWVDGQLTSFHQTRSKEPWPSRTVFLRGGKVLLIHFTNEVRGQRQGAGPSQKEKFAMLKELGYSVAVVSRCDEAVQVVKGVM